MKFIKWFFIVILLVALGTITAAFIYLQSSRPVYHGEVHFRELTNQVKVYFDNHGIPHIVASNDKDAYFALGYLHAQERLFQMELLRRVGAGRLSEVFGEEMVPVDAFFRTIGISKSAKEAVAMFFTKPNEPWQKNTLSYIKGINSFMFRGPTPPEFLMLGIPKSMFTPEDIYLITGYMSFSFAEALRTDPLLDKILRKHGKNYLDALNWGENISTHYDTTVIADGGLAYFVNDIFSKLPVAPWIGSNGWAVSPSKSASGKVLFANDTHIGYQQPAVWYEAHIEYPGFSLYGNYLAGMPFPLIGHTRDMAWGLTMFENDDMNLYREKVSSEYPDKYNYKGVWENFKTKEEVIKIKNKSDTIITIRESIHGPVINDVISQLDHSEKDPVSLWWTYTRFPSTALKVAYDLAYSSGIDDTRKAASMVNAPGLNIVYGDKSGNIAIWSAAKLPVYSPGINTKIILDGSSGEDDILGYYDFSENPQIENPESGFIFSANQKPDTSWGDKFPGYYAPDFRSSRIETVLASKEKWSINDFEMICNDAVSNAHPKIASIILEVLKGDAVLTLTPIHSTSTDCLRNWQGTHALKDTAPTIYYKLLSNILELTMSDEMGEVDFNILVNTHLMKNSYVKLLSDEDSPWWDDVTTTGIKETRKQIFAEAFRLTIESLQLSSGDMTNWSWGSFHTVEHIHPLGRKSPLDKIFNVGPFPVKGGIETINNAGFPLNTTGRFKVNYGPAMRVLIDFNDVENGLSVIPTGQSGHIRSPYYSDQSSLHISGKFRPMMMNRSDIATKCTNILTLRPAIVQTGQ